MMEPTLGKKLSEWNISPTTSSAVFTFQRNMNRMMEFYPHDSLSNEKEDIAKKWITYKEFRERRDHNRKLLLFYNMCRKNSLFKDHALVVKN